MIINDVPVRSEIAEGEVFSAISNLNILTSLRTGKANVHRSPDEGYTYGITADKIYTTYLDYSYYGENEVEGNFDFNKEFKKLDQLEEYTYSVPNERGVFTNKLVLKDKQVNFINEANFNTDTYVKLENQQNVYVSYRLYSQFMSLLEEIEKVNPTLVIVTGKWTLMFLTGTSKVSANMGIPKPKPFGALLTFRGSVLSISEEFKLSARPIVYPLLHTVNLFSMPEKEYVMNMDLERAGYLLYKSEEKDVGYFLDYKKTYIIGDSLEKVMNYLDEVYDLLEQGELYVSIDIETKFRSIIDCVGLAYETDRGICIPFSDETNPCIFSIEDETAIMWRLREVMLHKNCRHVGQNYDFDMQYFFKLWKIEVKTSEDTMGMHHVLYNYLPKDLGFLASLYCERYSNWKGNRETSRWEYNIDDATYTLEIMYVLKEMLMHSGDKLYQFYRSQIAKIPMVVGMQNRGVDIDIELKQNYYNYFHNMLLNIQTQINEILGFEFNPNSSPQKQKLFSDFFGMKLKKKKVKDRGYVTTCDAAAMLDYIDEYPMYKPFLVLLLEHASLKVFTSTFLGMELDEDNRARTQYHVFKTATNRFASTKNVWGKGANFQNIPEKGKINLHYALEVSEGYAEEDNIKVDYLSELQLEGSVMLPNCKKMFIPIPGYEFADLDYSGADAMIVAWESDCKWLIDFFLNRKEKLYAYIASEHLQREITSSSPEYKVYKSIIHGSNYGIGLKKIADTLRISNNSAKVLQDFYFTRCPEVKQQQQRIVKQISDRGYIENIFGARGWFLNKNDVNRYNKAYAWTPQSTIASLINEALYNMEKLRLEKGIPIYPTLQVHDSGVPQYPKELAETIRPMLLKCMEVVLPYKHPLIIPADIKVSDVSYGDTRKVKIIADV